MVKNAKIVNTAHRALSIKASQLEVKKGDLCSALIVAALARLTDAEILEALAHIAEEPDAEHPQNTVNGLYR